MNIILDTNVLMSGIHFGGLPRLIIDLWAEKKIQFILSADIYEEYRRIDNEIIERYPSLVSNRIIELIGERSKFYLPINEHHEKCTDKNDQMFINCAVSSKSKVIVSGDKVLTGLNGYLGIEVLNPRAFLEKYFKSKLS